MGKLKAATLLETLVATVLILVIFVVSGLIINNLAKNNIQKNYQGVETEMKKLGYFGLHKKITLPHTTEYKNWTIEVRNSDDLNDIEIEAWQDENNKILKSKVYVVE